MTVICRLCIETIACQLCPILREETVANIFVTIISRVSHSQPPAPEHTVIAAEIMPAGKDKRGSARHGSIPAAKSKTLRIHRAPNEHQVTVGACAHRK